MAKRRGFEPRIVADHVMVQEDFERLHKFLLETEGVEEEWPELVHKLRPRELNA